MDESLKREMLYCENVADFLEFWLSHLSLLAHGDAITAFYQNFTADFRLRKRRFYAMQHIDVVNTISQKRSAKLLDISCGCGVEALWFAKLGARVTALDTNAANIAVAGECRTIAADLLEGEVHCEFLQRSPQDLGASGEKFDIIWAGHVLRHDPDGLLKLAAQVLNDNGFLVVGEMNGGNLLLRSGLLGARDFSNAACQKRASEKLLAPKLLEAKLGENGFKVNRQRFFRVFSGKEKYDRYEDFEENLSETLPFFFTHYNLVASKKGA